MTEPDPQPALTLFAVASSKAPALEIHCAQGSISIDLPSWYAADAPVAVYLADPSIHGVEGWVPQVQPPGREPALGTLVAGTAHFIDCGLGRAEPVLTAEHALHMLEIMLAAGVSAREGRAITLETSL